MFVQYENLERSPDATGAPGLAAKPLAKLLFINRLGHGVSIAAQKTWMMAVISGCPAVWDRVFSAESPFFWRTERALPYAAAIISRKQLILSVVTVNRGAEANSVPDVSVFRLVWVVPCVVLTVGYFYNCLLEIHRGQMG